MNIKNIVRDIKVEYKRRPLITLIMFASLALGLLSFLKPAYTQSFWGAIGITSFNLFFIGTGLFLIYWFYIRGRLR